MASKTNKNANRPSTAEIRRSLQADVDAFLAAGNHIQQVPSGVSGQDPQGSRRHILRSGARKRT